MSKWKFYRLVMVILVALALVVPVQADAETVCYCENHPSFNQSDCAAISHQWICYETGPTEEELAAQAEAEAAAEAAAARARAAAAAKAAEEAAAAAAAAAAKAAEEAFNHESQKSVEGTQELTTDLIRDTSIKVIRNVNSRIRTVNQPRPAAVVPGATTFNTRGAAPMIGMAAGGEESKFGVWFNPSYSWLDSDRNDSEYDGSVFLVMGGIDYKATSKILIGLALSYEDADLDTDYNDGTFDNHGYALAPYLAVSLTDNLSFDVVAAYTWLDNDVTRSTTMGDLDGSYDSDRYMVSANINYYRLVTNWNLSAVAGYLYTDEDMDSYEESGDAAYSVDDGSVHLGELRVGGRVGYFINAMEPYCSVAYLYDASRSDASGDRDEMEGVLGVNYYPTDQFILGAEVRNSFFRSDFTNTELMVNIRYEF